MKCKRIQFVMGGAADARNGQSPGGPRRRVIVNQAGGRIIPFGIKRSGTYALRFFCLKGHDSA
jgi:hypothetical protein